MAEWVYCSNECKRMRWCSLEQAWHDTKAAYYAGSFYREHKCPDCGTACGLRMVTNAPTDESPEWELEHVADYLRSFPRDDADDYGVAGVYLGLVDMDGTLTIVGAALLALLEAEHCKQRIEAAGCDWLACATDVSVWPRDVESHQIFETDGAPDWRSAAEYAEAHAQGVPE
jgi:hypothetical protein